MANMQKDEALENLAVRMAALSYLRWNEIDDETKDRYRYYAKIELERRKREAELEPEPTMMPPLKL